MPKKAIQKEKTKPSSGLKSKSKTVLGAKKSASKPVAKKVSGGSAVATKPVAKKVSASSLASKKTAGRMAEGKKTLASATAGTKSASSPATKENAIRKLADGTFAKVVKVRKKDGSIGKKLVRCDQNGNLIKPQAKPALNKPTKSEPVQSKPSTAEVSVAQKKVEEEKPKNADFDREKFLSRVRSRHSFLSALEKGGKASEVTGIETARVDDDKKSAPSSEFFEEAIETDESVTKLENSVLNRQLDNMTGKGASKGVSASSSSLGVSGAASNPNASKNIPANSTANSIKTQNLTGSFVNLASKESGYVLPDAERKVKDKKRVKPWVVCVSLASAVVIAFVTVFLCLYNFGAKHINIITYELKVENSARTKYYDGELVDFGGISMEFLTNGADAQSYSMTLASVGNLGENAGFELKEGCIVVDWSGENALKTSVDVSLPIVCNEESDWLHLTVFRNKLVGLESLAEVDSLSAGTKIYPNLFGVYENAEILDEDKLKFALSTSLYTLYANVGTVVAPEWVDLKTVDGVFDAENKCFSIPSSVGGVAVTVVQLKAVYTGTYFNAGEGDKMVATTGDKLVELMLG